MKSYFISLILCSLTRLSSPSSSPLLSLLFFIYTHGTWWCTPNHEEDEPSKLAQDFNQLRQHAGESQRRRGAILCRYFHELRVRPLWWCCANWKPFRMARGTMPEDGRWRLAGGVGDRPKPGDDSSAVAFLEGVERARAPPCRLPPARMHGR